MASAGLPSVVQGQLNFWEPLGVADPLISPTSTLKSCNIQPNAQTYDSKLKARIAR